MLKQQDKTESASFADTYCALCGFGPDEELPGYVDCPDHLWLVVRGHRRELPDDDRRGPD